MPHSVEITRHLILSDVKIVDQTLIYTTIIGPEHPNWPYCRNVANDESDLFQMPAFRHINCRRTDNPDSEEYALTTACNSHPEHPFFESERVNLNHAWLLPDDHPQREMLIKDAIGKIANDLRFYRAGISSYVQIDPDDDEAMLKVLERFEQAEVASGERPPRDGEEHLAPQDDDF